jgi:hypothetical protein
MVPIYNRISPAFFGKINKKTRKNIRLNGCIKKLPYRGRERNYRFRDWVHEHHVLSPSCADDCTHLAHVVFSEYVPCGISGREEGEKIDTIIHFCKKYDNIRLYNAHGYVKPVRCSECINES